MSWFICSQLLLTYIFFQEVFRELIRGNTRLCHRVKTIVYLLTKRRDRERNLNKMLVRFPSLGFLLQANPSFVFQVRKWALLASHPLHDSIGRWMAKSNVNF